MKYTEWGYREPSYDNPGGCVLVNGNERWKKNSLISLCLKFKMFIDNFVLLLLQTHGLYGWSDGWPVKYTEWGYKEPSYDNPGGCVLVNGNGRWNDTDCSRKLSYVCKISSGTSHFI